MPKKLALLLASFLGLFLELCLIRWFPAHLFSIAFFANAVLIGSFLGLGLGFLSSHSQRELFRLFPWILAGTMVLVVLLQNVQVALPPDARTWIWSYDQHFRLFEASPLKLSITQLVALAFVLTVLVFIPVGQKTAKLMKGFAPLTGYTLNVLGSLLGVVGFGVLSVFNAPAFVWFAVVAALFAAVAFRERGFLPGALLLAGVAAAVGFVENDLSWSPYYAIQHRTEEDRSVSVYINQLFHQRALNFDLDQEAAAKFTLPYDIFRPKRVLIIGAGTGNDVWAALQAGAEQIDAVEIDPVIVELGRREHPQRPYDSAKVSVIVDDARSFLHRTEERYDLVVFGTLDSHASLSVSSSLRLDNYVYTREALQEARQVLGPHGAVVLLFSVQRSWIATRLLETVRAVFGSEDVRFLPLDPYLFNLMILAGPGVGSTAALNFTLSGLFQPLPPKAEVALPTDDWPYLYLNGPTIPYLYWITLLVLLSFSVVAVLVASPLLRRKIDPVFLLLGSGFLLLETKSVTTFSLLFGSTWLVNAVVFAALLAIALLANTVVATRRWTQPLWWLGGMVLALLVVFLIPIGGLLKLPFLAKCLAAGALVALPIFFSSVAFSILFAGTKDTGTALGSNLLGAVIGGFLEYASMIFGLNALYLVALLGYSAAALLLLGRKKQTVA